jgi:hypothetical protein
MFKTGAQEEHTGTHMIQLKQMLLFYVKTVRDMTNIIQKAHFCIGRIVVFAGRNKQQIH